MRHELYIFALSNNQQRNNYGKNKEQAQCGNHAQSVK